MEEEDDVDWEDEASFDDADAVDAEAEAAEEPINIKIDSTGTVQPPPNDKKKKSVLKRVNFSDEDYQQCLMCHQDDAESQIGLSKTVSLSCVSSRIVSLVVADVPGDIADSAHYDTPFGQLIEIMKWVKRTYREVPHNSITAEEGRDGSGEWDLENFVLKNKAGSSNQLCQLFAALLVGLGYHIRILRTMDPVSFCPQDHPEVYEKRWLEANPNSTASFKPRKAPAAPIVHTWLEVFTRENATQVQVVTHRQQASSSSSCSSSSAHRVCSASHGVIDLTDSGDEGACDSQLKATPASPPVCTTSSVSPRGDHRSVAAGRWVAVDVVHQRIDQPRHLEEVLRRTRPLQYVLAFEFLPASGASQASSSSSSAGSSSSSSSKVREQPAPRLKIIDVTSEYKLRHHYSTNKDKQTRAEVDTWLVSLLDAYNQGTECSNEAEYEDWSASYNKAESQVVDLTDDVWDIDKHDNPTLISTSEPTSSSGDIASASKRARSSDEHPMPVRVNDFKDHPVYLLTRHLLSEQALHPSAYAVGVFRGESVYLQVHKETLRTRLQWRRSLRQVRRDEEPIKVVQRRVRVQGDDGLGEGYAHGNGGDGGEGGGSKMIEIRLFGSWQTETIKIEPVRDGVIPANEHGNIEVWEGNTKFVPAGAVFIDDPAVLKTAKQLDLPCVPAVVGFERKGLHNVPIIGGVVVLKQHASILQDASFFVEAVKEETHYMKKEKEMIVKWERLAYGVLSRQKLREKYGH